MQKIIANLDRISSAEEPEELERLEANLTQLFASENPELGIDALLRVFERFPEKDGFCIFWSILSGLESLPDYEGKLIASVRRQPSRFGLLMVNRMLNAGITEVEGVNLLSLLKGVAADESQSEELREEARDFIEWQERDR